MIALWLFAVFWCAVSFSVLGHFLKSSAAWSALLFAAGMTLPGVLIVLGLLAAHYQRWRVGRITLTASPEPVTGGEPVRLRLDVARDDLGPRSVRFRLQLQQDDEGWRTVQTLEQAGQLQPGVPWVHGVVTLPLDARASGRGWRWHAEAMIEGFRLATAQCDVAVLKARPVRSAAQAAAEVDVAQATAPGFDAAQDVQAPSGAREVAAGTWAWHQRYGFLTVVGGVLLAFSAFWLWRTLGGVLPELRDLRQGVHLRALGSLLFQVPFVAAGVAVGGLALGLLTLQLRGTARPGGASVEVFALGRTWITVPVQAGDIERLQAAPGLVNNGKVLHYSLAARTSQGVVTLPMKSDSPQGLLPQARWLARVLGVVSLRFDPVVMDEDEPRFALFDRSAPADQWKRLAGMGRALKPLMAACIGLGALGFVLQFLGAALPR